jgi:hypothetical protein
MTCNVSVLEVYVNVHKKQYMDRYGRIDGMWYDRVLYCVIADYASMIGKFTQEDIDFINRTEFEPEDFLK